MQPNEQTVSAMRDAARGNTATQGNKPQGPLGILAPKNDTIEGKNKDELAAAGAASSNTAKAGANAGQPTTSRTGIAQGQTTATGLISGAMTTRRI